MEIAQYGLNLTSYSTRKLLMEIVGMGGWRIFLNRVYAPSLLEYEFMLLWLYTCAQILNLNCWRRLHVKCYLFICEYLVYIIVLPDYLLQCHCYYIWGVHLLCKIDMYYRDIKVCAFYQSLHLVTSRSVWCVLFSPHFYHVL